MILHGYGAVVLIMRKEYLVNWTSRFFESCYRTLYVVLGRNGCYDQ
jgi:hypothetical protein